MKDEELLVFMTWFTDSRSGIEVKSLDDTNVNSDNKANMEQILESMMVKLLGSLIKVITQKIKKLNLKTLIGVVWSLSRLNLQAEDKVLILFADIKTEILTKLEDLSEKSIAMLMWCYSRQESPDKEFLEKLKNWIQDITHPSFDNFDLMLIVHAWKIFEGSHLKEDNDFMSTTMSMLSYLESYVVKEIKKMNIHEFMTVSTFYLMRNLCSQKTATVFKNMIVEHIDEFNQVQLALLISSLKANTLEDHTYLIDTLTSKIEEKNEDDELPDVDEEKLRLLIREKLKQMMAEKQHKAETDQKLGIKSDRATKEQESYFDLSNLNKKNQDDSSSTHNERTEDSQKHYKDVPKKQSSVEEEQISQDEPELDEGKMLKDKIKNVFGIKTKSQETVKESQDDKANEKPRVKSGISLKDYLLKKKKTDKK